MNNNVILNYNNVWKLFENFNHDIENFLGAFFINIYHEIPIVYSCFYNKDNEFCYTLRLDKNKIKDSEHTIKGTDTIKNFINSDLFEVIQGTPFEYFIIGKYFPMLINISTCSPGEKETYITFENVYIPTNTSEKNIQELFDILKNCFVSGDKEANIEFGIAAVDTCGSLYTHYYDYDRIDIDINKNYNDDLPYDKMIEILNRDKSSLMLFYGDPGTGKTTLIKKFISEMPDKEFIFMDGTLLANVQQERLMGFFLENRKAIYIFEDCEKILLNRDKDYNPTMSILLNLTDGIISDVLNIKIICTFNTALNNIDKALLRKGRLSLKYEFKKLDKEKTNNILNKDINKEMTLSDIYHYLDENDYSKKNTGNIGFLS